ncbi:MAG: pitrilysin family protein [Cytophagales bacterium]|nr:pitrilysin family protein [Cytophagales bacterium]
MLNRAEAPAAYELQPFPILKHSHYTIPNGINIYAINQGTQPLAKIDYIFDAGSAHESKQALSYMCSKMMLEGTSKYTGKELAEQIALYGAYLDITSGFDKLTLSVMCMTKHIVQICAIVHDIITQCIFPESNYETVKNIGIQNIRVNMQKTSFIASQSFRKHIFGESHAYGYSVDEKQLKSLKNAEVIKFYKQKICDQAFEIIISGQMSDEVIQHVKKDLSTLKFKYPKAVSPTPLNAQATTQSKIFEKKDGSVQSSIRIGKKLFVKKHPDYIKFTVMNEVLGGYFGARLMKNLREDKGLTYGIHSSATFMQQEGYWAIAADVNAGNTTHALNEIYKEIDLIRSQKVPAAELNTAKNYMIGQFYNAFSTPFQSADRLRNIHLHGLDYAFYETYIQNIKKVTSADVQKMAEKYLDPTSLTEIVAGNK